MRKKPGTQPGEILTDIYNILYSTFGPQHWWPAETPFEIAVGAILTQNTSWGNVEKAIRNLKEHNALDVKSMLGMPEEELALLIKPAGYFNIKARRLREFLLFLVENFSGDMKKLKKEDNQSIRARLLDVKGIGPETADSILLYAVEKPVFVVDAYTKRALERHGLIPGEATYAEVQLMFHANLPMSVSLFNEYHALFVKLGKNFCRKTPECGVCPLSGIYGFRGRITGGK